MTSQSFPQQSSQQPFLTYADDGAYCTDVWMLRISVKICKLSFLSQRTTVKCFHIRRHSIRRALVARFLEQRRKCTHMRHQKPQRSQSKAPGAGKVVYISLPILTTLQTTIGSVLLHFYTKVIRAYATLDASRLS